MVWSTNAEQAKNLIKLSENEFVDAINEALVSQILIIQFLLVIFSSGKSIQKMVW